MRGATNKSNDVSAARTISIHAPHAGRDFACEKSQKEILDFNPRAPCGARPPICKALGISLDISIHAPHAGRDETQGG